MSHPEWCDLSSCQPYGSTRGGGHYSQPATWPTEDSGHDVQVRLIHSDDLHPRTGEDAATTRVHLQILGTEDTEVASAWLHPHEARAIATLLTRYADMADRFPDARYPADDIVSNRGPR